jgi:hypothetical protein
MVIYNYFGLGSIDSVTLHYGSGTVVTTAGPTAPATTTTTTATTTAAPETTVTTAETTITSAGPTTPAETTATTTAAETTTTTTEATTAAPVVTTTVTTAPSTEDSENSIVLTDVAFGTAYSLADYDYKAVKSITISLSDTVENAGGCLVLGGWSESHSIAYADLDNGIVTFEISNPQDTIIIYNYYGLGTLNSVTLNF